jgi:ankyrin repeat protein
VSAVDSKGKTPIHHAIEMRFGIDILNILLSTAVAVKEDAAKQRTTSTTTSTGSTSEVVTTTGGAKTNSFDASYSLEQTPDPTRKSIRKVKSGKSGSGGSPLNAGKSSDFYDVSKFAVLACETQDLNGKTPILRAVELKGERSQTKMTAVT